MHVRGQILTPHGFISGTLHFDRRIEGISSGEVGEQYVLPGFIDTHVHGGGGGT
ncbi:hypothetical protein [Deinococcus hopiensis]|uniref:hypothetical protein n=1 Tax=Deinococcus hopiensis TaxID=309885 RepID=UPI001FE487C3|nr:hypothetical protein [Deinococcus hopiensis]